VVEVEDGRVTVDFKVSTSTANPNDLGTFTTNNVYREPPPPHKMPVDDVEVGMVGYLSIVAGGVPMISTESKTYHNVAIVNPNEAWIFVLKANADRK
jgi:hypothetical protein